MKKLIIIFFSAALGISFLFIGFGSYVSTNHVIKLGNTKITTNELDFYKNIDVICIATPHQTHFNFLKKATELSRFRAPLAALNNAWSFRLNPFFM